MRSRRWVHAVAAGASLAAVVATASAGPDPGAAPGPTWAPRRFVAAVLEGVGSGSDAPAPTPTGRPAEGDAVDVPPWVAGPPRFAVAPFENHSTVRALDWLVAGAPFEIAEKTENVLGLPAAGGPLAVPGAAVESDPISVAAYAHQVGATYVITGWVQRPNWELRLDAAVWKVAGGVAVVAGEAKRQGPIATYPQMLGEVMTEMWTKAGVPVDSRRAERLARPLSKDLYPVELMGRGLGFLVGALGKPDLKTAEHDLERSAFIDPKMAEVQRVLGELYLAQAAEPRAPGSALPEPARLLAKAAGKFNYAVDLAPDDLGALRAAAGAATAAGKHDIATDLYRKIVVREPWDLDARYQLGAALWATGDAARAEAQLTQVVAAAPDRLPARRVLALIHASRSDTPRLIAELEAIAVRAPTDLDVKADLASAFGAVGRWRDATVQLEAIAAARPPELALLVRIGDGHRKAGDLDGALAAYARAQRLAPEASYPGFMAAQALFDAGRLTEATRAYTLLQKFKDDVAAAEGALGAIALAQGRADDGAWYLRRAVREAPRSVILRRGVIAAELARRDATAALAQVAPALAAWPADPELHYLAGVAYALAGDRDHARGELAAAPGWPAARTALGVLDSGVPIALAYRADIERPWGDAEAVTAALDRFAATSAAMAAVRVGYQTHLLTMLGALGAGPSARLPLSPPSGCPLAAAAPAWAAAQRELASYAQLGADLEAAYRFIARHEEIGASAALLPTARTAVTASRASYRTALADLGELRAEWARSLVPELHRVGCSDALLGAAAADPARYHVIEEDRPEPIPTHAPPRGKPRVTFYVDNTSCPDPVDVAVDGAAVGQVAPHKRSAFLADGGERTLCLLGPNAAECGDRGTNRTVYLHDGWSVTLKCTAATPEPRPPEAAPVPEAGSAHTPTPAPARPRAPAR